MIEDGHRYLTTLKMSLIEGKRKHVQDSRFSQIEISKKNIDILEP
jgi:hypothetical protein